MDNFTIRSKNPNAEYGGGGCLCSDMKDEDCKGPYVVWDAVDMASPSNPYPVACQRCITHALHKMDEGAVLDKKDEPAPEKEKKDKRGTNEGGFVELEI